MKIPFSILFTIILSLDVFAAPVPTAQDGTELALEVRKTPAKKPVAKPVAKPAANRPVAKPATKPVVKPVAKPAANKPVAKPSANKPVTKPAAKPVAKPVAKPTAKPVTKPAAACPITDGPKKTATKAVKAKAKRMLGTITRKARIANRTFFGLIQPRLTPGNEFVGWHGTNEKTAGLWESKGEIVRPIAENGQTTVTRQGASLDAELGNGLYLSDTLSLAVAAANSNKDRTGLAATVCAIFAKSSSGFRDNMDKVDIPDQIRGDPTKGVRNKFREEERVAYISSLRPAIRNVQNALRLGPVRKDFSGIISQMLIPESQNPQFEAQCFDLTPGTLESPGATAFENENGAIKYPSLISEWKIVKADDVIAEATVAAIEGTCNHHGAKPVIKDTLG